MVYFQNRSDAGRQLAKRLLAYKDQPDVLVLGLPRGGVPVAYELARALHAPLDIFIVRKLGVPGHSELAMGAISSGGGQVLNVQVVDALGIERAAIETVASREWHEIERRERLYRKNKAPARIEDRVVILTDDGLATGSTMLAGIKALRHLNPRTLVAAVPVAPPMTCSEISSWVDEMVCLAQPDDFYSVGQWYEDFTQTSDEEVCALLEGVESTPGSGMTRPRGAGADTNKDAGILIGL